MRRAAARDWWALLGPSWRGMVWQGGGGMALALSPLLAHITPAPVLILGLLTPPCRACWRHRAEVTAGFMKTPEWGKDIKTLASQYISLYVCTCSGKKKKKIPCLETRQLCSFCLELGSSDLSSFLPFSLAVLWTADIETLCSQARQLALQHLIPTHAVLAHFQRLR